MSYKHVIIGFAAVANLAGCGPSSPSEDQVSADVPTPDGFVQIDEKGAIELAAALPKCIIKQFVLDARATAEPTPAANAFQAGYIVNGKSRQFSPEISAFEAAAMRTTAIGLDWVYSSHFDCGKKGDIVLSEHDKGALPSFVLAPNEDGTRVKVVVLAAGGKYFTPKVAPF